MRSAYSLSYFNHPQYRAAVCNSTARLTRFRSAFGRIAVALACLTWMACGTLSWSQITTASVAGTVSDPSQAVIPNTTVTVTNTSTGVAGTTTTDSSGHYVFLSLPVGTYDLTIAQSGFQTSSISGITLRVDQRATQNVTLNPGGGKQTVTVEATPSLVDTTSASLGTVVSQSQILNMPLNLREVTALALLVPGTVNTTGRALSTGSANGSGFNDFGYSGSGGGSGGNLLLIDGMISRALNNSSFALAPPPEMVHEFKIQNNIYDASFGMAGGTVMNLITNSGTNAIHGTAWEFARNSVMDATGYFALTRPESSRNQFGGAIGGPILKNRMFYFGAYEGLRLNEARVAPILVPTDAQKQGDFSDLLTGTTANLCASSGAAAPANMNFDTGQLFDPATEYNYTCPANPANPGAEQSTILVGTPIAGNIIQNVDPVAQKVLQLFPAPNTSGIFNYINQTPQVQDNDQFDARVDANLSKRNSLFVRYMLGNSNIVFPGDNPNFNAYQHFRGHNLVGGWTFVIGPSTINDVRVGYQHDFMTYTCQGCPRPAGTLSGFGIAGLTNPLPAFDTLYPNFTFVNYPTWGDGFPGYFPVAAPDSIEHFGDTFTKVMGRHTLAFGGTLDFWQTKGVTDPRQVNGDFDFNGQYASLAGEIPDASTSADLADLELGFPSGGSYTKNAIVTNLVGGRWIGLFVQDNIHVSSRFSVQAGLRWEYDRQPMDEHDQMSTIFPLSKDNTPGNAFLITALPDSENDALCSNAYFISASGQCLIMSSSMRKTKGLTGNKRRQMSYGPGAGLFAPRLGISWQPMGSDKFVVHAGAGIFSNLSDTNRMGSFANNNPVTTQTPTYTTAFGAPPPLTNGAPTQTQQVFANAPSVSLQDVSAQMMPSPFYNIPKTYEWSLSLQSQVSRSWGAEVAYVGNRGVHLDFEHEFANQPTPGIGPLQSRRPWPDFGKMDFDDYTGYSSYNSVYGKLEKRVSNGFAALISYTFSKALDNGNGNVDNETRLQNDNDPRADYGPSDFNVSQTFVASPIYELPFGRGKRFLSDGRVANTLAGGWQVSAIITAYSGYPITIKSSNDYSNTGSKSPRPDRVCSGVGPKTISEWYDTSCFTTVALAQALANGTPRFGTSGRNIITGPGVQNWDLAFIKRTKIGDRVTTEFRGELFNAFNHTNLGTPGITVGKSSAGVISSGGSPRNIQLAVKLLF